MKCLIVNYLIYYIVFFMYFVCFQFFYTSSNGMTKPGKFSPTKPSGSNMSRSMTNLQACGQNRNRFSEIPFMSNNIGQSKHSVSTTSLISIQSKYNAMFYYHEKFCKYYEIYLLVELCKFIDISYTYRLSSINKFKMLLLIFNPANHQHT